MRLKIFNTYSILLLLLLLSSFTGCGDNHDNEVKASFIEDTEGGEEIIEREFGENFNCDEGDIFDDNEPNYVRNLPWQTGSAAGYQRSVEHHYPHTYSSLDQMFPERGSWRQTKDEIMDLVDRHLWSPERQGVVRMLNYFDMALLINVAPRKKESPQGHSAQHMQIYVRTNNSDNFEDWKRIATWPISSGIPCGKRIATFTGVYKFNPSRMYSDYKSSLWDDIDMYESMFLYHKYQNDKNTGVAIHGTYLTERLGYRDSGGCVRVYREDSKCLFETITGRATKQCLDDTLSSYRGTVPSFLPTHGEADPEYFGYNNNRLEMDGYRVLIAIFNDSEDRL